MNSKAADRKQDPAEDCNKASTSTSTSTSQPLTDTATSSPAAMPSSALSKKSSRKPRKRAKVSFSQEVISKDGSGDGSKVVIKEEHGIFLGPLLGRMMVSSSSDQIHGEEEGMDASKAASSSRPAISFANDSHTIEKLSYTESSHGILKSTVNNSQPLGDNGIDYDNLVVQMGLLKCGHRYQAVVPVPDYWNQNTPENKGDAGMDVLIVEDSLDGDLKGEVQTEYASSDESAYSLANACQHHLCITLSARRRGPYRGRFVLELTRHSDQIVSQKANSISDDATETESDTLTSEEASKTNNPPSNKKCLMSLQVDATIMGKDMGTPKLRNGVACLGKMVGYDSDEETEWQGFV